MKTILTTILVLSTIFTIDAQWAEIGTIQNDNIYNTTLLNNNIVASGEKGSIYYLNQSEPTVPKNIFSPFGFLNSFYTVDEDIAYIGGGCYFTFDECPGNTLYKTTDAGETWENVESEKTFNDAGNINGIFPISEDEIAIVREYQNIYKINTTTGVSIEIHLSDSANINYLDLSQISKSGNWLVRAQNNSLETGSYQTYYESTDKGETWTILDFGLEDGENPWHVNYKPDNSISLLTTNRKLYRFDGTTSEFISDLPNLENSISSQFVVDNDVIYIATHNPELNKGYLHRSDDGGMTWENDFTIDSSHINSMVFTDKDNGYLITGFRNIHQRTGLDVVLEDELSKVSISPNPVAEYINIESTLDLSGALFEVISIDGRVLNSKASMTTQIDVRDLSAGIYFLRVYSLGKNYTERFVKI